MSIRSKRIISDDSLASFMRTCQTNKISILAFSTLGKTKSGQNTYFVKYISDKEI